MTQTTSTRPKQDGTPERGRSLYETDLHAWSLEQARLLREGRLDEVDAENVAEEILDVGRTEYDKLESALRVLLMHMLKWDHQPERRTRAWENTIREQRYRAERQLRDNPSLKSRREEAVREGHRSARLAASSETDMDVDRSPRPALMIGTRSPAARSPGRRGRRAEGYHRRAFTLPSSAVKRTHRTADA